MKTKKIIWILMASVISSGIFAQPDTTKRKPLPNGRPPIPGRKDTARHSKTYSNKKDTVVMR